MIRTSSQKSPDSAGRKIIRQSDIPEYLRETYWWAYLHPNAIRIFERQWLINSILWGNYRRLRDALLSEIDFHYQGKILQLACVYGDLTEKIASKLSLKGQLDLVDISQAQLDNAVSKLGKRQNINLIRQDTSSLSLPDEEYDLVVLFFLLHEQPEDVRQGTVSEAIRLTRNGGKIIVIDYHRAALWNPLRYFMDIIFKWLEPFAKGFVQKGIKNLLPRDCRANIDQKTFFGGLYQKTVIELQE
jgi:ubiquinone/menaquinone biosynthesis C-methylase UbiE